MPNALRPALRPAVLLTLVATSLGPFGSGQDKPTEKGLWFAQGMSAVVEILAVGGCDGAAA